MENLILALHEWVGEIPFLAISLITAVIFCIWFIPKTTDSMVNSAAGLAGQYFGNNQRTLVINSSTNNPELFLMIVSLSLGRLGGIATPLGSNFANIYLMFIVAPLIVSAKWLITGKFSRIKNLINLINTEKRLFCWHFLMSITMFFCASIAYWCMTGTSSFYPFRENLPIRNGNWLLIAGLVCLLGTVIFFLFENKLKKRRPELFEDINNDNFEASWIKFISATVGLIIVCYLLNCFFLVWTEIYSGILSKVFGAEIFVGLHYFVGSLISSLPEATVAVENYERLTSPDLNTALASASQSNMTNLAIGCLGSIIASIFLLTGFNYQL